MKRTTNPHLIIGALIAAVLLIFVNRADLFGFTCYYVGRLTMRTSCIEPAVYKGAWVIAAVFIGSGLYARGKRSGPPAPPPPGDPAEK
jgi:hypothetical protein